MASSNEAPGSPPSPGRIPGAIRACAAVALIPATLAVIGTTFGVVAQLIRKDLELDSIQMGILSSIYLVPLAFLQMSAGRMVDRLGVRRVAIVVAVAAGLATMAFALSGSFLTATTSRLAMGCAAAFGMPMYGVVAARVLSARAVTLAMGVVSLAFGVAGFLGGLLGDAALARGDWRLAMWLVPILSVPIAVIVGWALNLDALRTSEGSAATESVPAPDSAQATSASPAASSAGLLALLRVPQVRRAVIVAFAVGGMFWSLGGYWNAVIARIVWNLPQESWGAVGGAFQLGVGISAPLLALWAMRVGTQLPIRWCTGLAFISFAMWIFSPVELGATASQAVVALLGVSAAALAVNIASALRCVSDASAGACVGLLSGAATLGGMLLLVLPPITTLIPDSTPLLRTYICGGAIALMLGAAHVTTYGKQGGNGT